MRLLTLTSLAVVLSLFCLVSASETKLDAQTDATADAEVSERVLDLDRGMIDASVASSARFAAKYDSGGCTPLIVWEDWCKKKHGNEWFEWEKRVPKLAKKVEKMSPNKRAEFIFSSMGPKHMYLQYLDGRSQKDGPNAFGPEYITDMKAAHKKIGALLKKGITRKNLNMEFYDDLHKVAFTQTAKMLKKHNGFRGANSWIYLPLPDKPMAIFHNIHYKGKLNFDKKLRVVSKLSEYPIKGWAHNRGYQLRWRYPNLEEKYAREKVQEIFNYFWDAVDKIPADKSEAQKRAAKLTAITWLYHALENFHCFVDGNGRTNVLVLQALLCWAGLHPVSFYNSMESALAAWEEEREVVLEGYFKWEESYLTGKTGWSQEEIDRKAHECKVAVDKVLKPRSKKDRKKEFIADTLGGCMCKNADKCETNEKFANKKWCYTDNNCLWGWDYCAEGRSSMK
jgi:hypothetical protein